MVYQRLNFEFSRKYVQAMKGVLLKIMRALSLISCDQECRFR